MEHRFAALKERLTEIDDLQGALSLMHWDQMTYMPVGAMAARGRQAATLSRLAHQKLTDPAIGHLLDEVQPWAESLPFDSDEAALVRLTRREYERARKMPSEFVARLAEHQSQTYEVWCEARPRNDFAAVCPYLEKTLDLSREWANFYPGYQHIADPLLDEMDYGFSAASVRAVFDDLRAQLTPLVRAIAACPPADDACLRRLFPQVQQEAFFMQPVRAFGLDMTRSRCDISPHPFTIETSITDVRITVRYNKHDLSEALFSALHEAGHAMYEQGFDLALEGTPLAGGPSTGWHESQSRLWENIVGRSRPFWTFYYPELQKMFPSQLGDVSLDTFYRAINKVQPSLIRTDADEVTYSLHVILRFDLELALLEGKLEVRHLPEAWRTRFEADLGIAPPDDKDGVLQDVHWYDGIIGGQFQGYALGNLIGAQVYEAALAAHSDIPAEMSAGRFDTLYGWLKENVYRHGYKFTGSELLERVTGGPLRVEPFIRYLRAKYGELYTL